MNTITIAANDEGYWLRDLSGMGAPIQCPCSTQLKSYRRLEARRLAAFGWHDGWGNGWAITELGKKELAS